MSHPTPAEPIRFQCRHILTDGRRCKNPTLRSPQSEENPEGHENFCYFHHTTRRPIENLKQRHSRRSTFTLPQLEDRSSIQLAIGEVLQRIACNDIDPRRAGLLLYGLQIASLNLPKLSPKEAELTETSETVDEIILHPTLGALAPPAELHSTEPKGSAQRLLERLPWNDEQDQQEDNEETASESTLPTLHAVADPSPHPRTTPNHPRLKNLHQNTGEGRRAHPHPRRSATNTRRSHATLAHSL
ncbi:MAG TPA: hypothetical protein VHY48_12600 [Acidobacteriaceae bacterium]|jgi:hypothetical protein|nr:hypothetical protein [Acidobacteriaceae bacterium]